MPTQDCPSLVYGHEGPVAQTLFLGSSVVNFNANMGWGGQASSVTVDLIDDIGDIKCTDVRNGGVVFKGNHGAYENHYYTCRGNDCYIDSEGRPFAPDPANPTKMKFRPGKVYYEFVNGKGFVSKYWRKRDPGFFGNLTSRNPISGNFGQMIQYEIIGSPVYFKCENFSFGGIVQSWDRNVSSGGLGYTVNLQGPDDILSNSWIILGEYSGSVFTANSNGYGLPANLSTNTMSGRGNIAEGAIHNVFNIYGFLESFGVDYFGSAKLNDSGIRANSIVDALQILTSSVQPNSYQDDLDWLNKNRFSPFGRILIKGMVEANTLIFPPIDIKSFGAIPPVLIQGHKKWPCLLDISELPRMPGDYRVAGPVMSIMDFIRQLTTDAGYDFYLEMFPIMKNNQVLNMIKLHTVSRNVNIPTNAIETTIKNAESSGLYISTSTLGKEANPANVRSLIIGPNIQRLYQAKNYRLAYHQTNFIFNPVTGKFINYRQPQNRVPGTNVNMPQPDKAYSGKMRMPDGYSMRNPALSRYVNGDLFVEVVNASESIRDSKRTFNMNDAEWKDTEIEAGRPGTVKVGNYSRTITSINNGSGRFIPLYNDVICPFFGYQGEETVELSTSDDPNVFRRVRPVWLDTWTGQLNILMYTHELPQTSVPLSTLYGSSLFSITESEIRAVKQGADSYLVYCCSKIFKPDLFVMLINGYLAAGHLIGGVANASFFGTSNMANTQGGPDIPRGVNGGASEAMMMELFLTPNFIRDFEILSEFVAKIGSYYGSKYMVKMPNLRAYQDYEYFTPITASTAPSSNDFNVYKGSGKIFYNYEPTTEAWEEQGNTIDDTIIVGDANFWSLASDTGTIPPIIGYNASSTFDWIRALMSTFPNIQTWFNTLAPNGTDGSGDWATGNYNIDMFMQWLSAKTGPYTYPSLDLSNLTRSEYVVINHPQVFKDGFGDSSYDHKKLYAKTSIEDKLVFLYPESLSEPRIIIDGLSLPLTQNSLAYEMDPSRTVIANVAIEELAWCLNITNNALDPWIRDYFLQYVSPVGIGGTFIKNSPSNNGVASSFAAMSPKVAHPFFAAVPIKSKIFSYGPWTNYPDLIKNQIYPGINNPHVENLIGGVTVEYDADLCPWNYGNMALLDAVAMKKVQSNANYQQILETASLQTPGLPLFGIGSRFDALNSIQYNTNETTLVHNNISYTIDASTYFIFKDVKANPASPLPSIPSIGTILYSPPAQKELPISQEHRYYFIKAVPSNYNGIAPIITNISLSMGGDITSTYTFRTATRKLGLFNKLDTDRIRNTALQNNKRNRQVYSLRNSGFNQSRSENMSLTSKIQAGSSTQTIAGGNGQEASNSLRRKFYGWSPSFCMIGGSSPFINATFIKEWVNKATEDESETLAVSQEDDESPKKKKKKKTPKTLITTISYGLDPGEGPDSAKLTEKPIETFMEKRRQQTVVGSYVFSEMRPELSRNYNAKALMSFDGLFSPVSFYPTVGWSTYSMTKYPTFDCPLCGGTSKIVDSIVDYSKAQPFKKKPTFYKCPYCSIKRDVPYDDGKKTASSSLEILPPYIVSSGSDIRNLIDLETKSSASSATPQASSAVAIPIHRNSLHPIVVPYGEFRNPNVHTTGTMVDRCRNNIQIIGRFDQPPKADVNLNTTYNIGSYFNVMTGKKLSSTTKGEGINIDFFDYDIRSKTPRGKRPLNNFRFLSLRGPLMLHGWGYDTNGYPVPNAADEPYFLDKNTGRTLRFKLIKSFTKKLYKDLAVGDVFEYPQRESYTADQRTIYGTYTKGASNTDLYVRETLTSYKKIYDTDFVSLIETKNDLENTGSSVPAGGDEGDWSELGDTITKQYSWDGSKWNDNGKSNKFHLNWAEKQELWPVGPIDLRWDHKRKIWTMNSGATIYKMVNIVLEEDLVKDDDFDETYPAKGFLDDAEYSTEKLKLNFRRMVYVKDTGGYTAPRGAKLLCRYNSDAGFYEPVSKPSFVCYGIIGNGNSATIQMSYVQGKKRGENSPTMMIYFQNLFSFNVVRGDKGLFTFIAGKWHLTAAK